MKEPIYKAKKLSDGKWYDGNYFQLHALDDSEEIVIHCLAYNPMWNFTDGGITKDCDYFTIDYNTLCEFTGLVDSFGNRIYVNDILSVRFEYDSATRDYPPDYSYESGIVEFDETLMQYMIRFECDDDQDEETIPLCEVSDCEICVIENKYDD